MGEFGNRDPLPGMVAVWEVTTVFRETICESRHSPMGYFSRADITFHFDSPEYQFIQIHIF